MNPRPALFLLFHFFALTCMAFQDPGQWQLQHFNDDNGLPQNSVKFISKTPQGYIWLSTEDGLVRYDGNTFRRFGKKNIPINSNRFQMLFLNSNGDSLKATTDLFEQISIEEGNIRRDLNASFWLKQWSSTDFDYKVTTLYATGMYNVRRSTKADYARVVIPGLENISFVYGKDTVRQYRENKLIQALPYQTKHDWNFFLLNNRLYQLLDNGYVHSFFPHAEQEPGGDILRDPAFRSGNRKLFLFSNLTTPGQVVLWFNQSFYLLQENADGKLSTRLLFSGFDAMAANICTAYFDSSNGRLYLGSQTNGFTIISPRQFRILTRPGAENIYYSQLEYETGKVLSNASSTFDLTENGKPLEKNFPDLNSDFYGLIKDQDGFLWTRNKYQMTRYALPDFKQAVSWKLSNTIADFTLSTNGQIWVGSSKDLFLLKNPVGTTPPEYFMSLPEAITQVVQKNKDSLFVCSANNLYLVSISQHKATVVSAMAGRYIRHIYQASPNEIWFSTYGDGFFLQKNGAFTQLPVDRMGYLSTTHCLTEDKKGFFWITTNKGLFRVLKADLLAWAAGKTDRVYYHYFDKSDGFNINEFNGGCHPCALKLGNGSISLPSMNGLVVFHPDSLQVQLPDKELFIDAIELDGKTKQITDLNNLPRHFGQLNFFISTPYSGNPKNVQIEYALLKNEQKPVWVPVPADHIISFASIPSGNYELLIRKMNGPGVNNFTEKRILITVSTAWYNTLAFHLGTLLLAGAIVWLIARIRTSYIKKKNRELELLVAEKTKQLQWEADMQEKIINSVNHDIQTPMQYQRLMSAKVEQLLNENRHADAMTYAKEVNKSTNRLYFMVENMLSYLKIRRQQQDLPKQPADLHLLTEQKRVIFESIAKEKSTQIWNNVPAPFIIDIDAQLLSVILHNLIDNAVKVTRNGSISINAQLISEGWELIVTDSGPGMPPVISEWINAATSGESPVKGLGLLMIRELSELLELNTTVISSPEKGTQFIIRNKS